MKKLIEDNMISTGAPIAPMNSVGITKSKYTPLSLKIKNSYSYLKQKNKRKIKLKGLT